ncbi:pyridoxamine 5'-phosphate oxidase [Simiduia agarivorans]|uniref:Pyridoxine/pyridoxamine 5'-phosphate oxidase n=1 Tax=Simiduia agarivorans (strain DSM 21679 / JCM 13881 / BCRC 17597 / SA1) TaxID=1117647 RepID=K4KNM5_SIMAS|nr:pyridoxamine 5'-phosphate oxidase [Simiduia agarivorans]AFV00765.1 pyridoxamine 5'-phosphate oxidase [Simiduia agarivorans SA1 = DSM 21679]
MQLEDLRRDYLMGGLEEADLDADPISQFEHWLQQAIELQLKDPTAMTVATVDASGQPSQRIVLLKQVDARGFVFFTNYGSRKAQELSANHKISLHFPWHDIERQVKVCGVASKISAAESAKYFLSRPKESQLAAWASHQSHPVSTRQLLMQQVARMKEKFAKGDIPAPDFWGGFRVVPHEIEFWQGGANRLHDRFVYQREGDAWTIARLAP